MKKFNLKLADSCHKTDKGLKKIIYALKRQKPEITYVYYSDGNIRQYSIVGELKNNLIPNKENAIKVEIGTTVTSIGQSAFYNCSSLVSITISDSVTSIGYHAFNNCSGLTSVTIPDSVTSIAQAAFEGCSGLASITIPDSVTSIGNNTFYYCSGLTSVIIPNSVTSIGNGAFNGCIALSSITSYRTTAPTVQVSTFGIANKYYTGRNTYSTGDNVLKIPQGATGYNSGAWLDPLQNSTKCGFHIEYLN